MADPQTDHDGPIVLFDGICLLCNGFVNFLITRDSEQHLKFAPLQSSVAGELLQPGRAPTTGETTDLSNHMTTMVLIEDGVAHTESTAALRTLSYISGPWRHLSVLLLVPRWIRDPVYHIVGKNRYRWFGKSATCRVPTAEERSRFL